MFKKILLIENRPARQAQYMSKDNLDSISKIQGFTMSSFEEILVKINNDTLDFLTEYSLVMIHRSALGELSNGSKITRVAKYCEENSIDLIYFSGGISSSFFIEYANSSFLLINSKEFYSDNFISFLKEYHEGKAGKPVKLIELKYGKSWKLNYLLQLRELIALNEKEPFEDSDDRIQNIQTQLSLKSLENINVEIKKEIANYE